MAFTNLWSKVIPAGGVSAKLIDEHARQLRLDIEERMAAVFKASVIGDADHPQPIPFARDPLVIRDELTGKKLNKKLVIPYSAFIKNTLGKEFVFDQYKLTAFTDTAPMFAPIILPPGVTFKKAELFNEKVNAGSVTMRILKRSFLSGQPTDDNQLIATINNALVGVVITPTVPDFAEVISDSYLYWIEIDAAGTAGNSFNIFGVRLTYDVPTFLETL